jgi:hypothetical protein
MRVSKLNPKPATGKPASTVIPMDAVIQIVAAVVMPLTPLRE